LDSQPRESEFEDISFSLRAKGVACTETRPMTTREAIRRLSVNASDCLAQSWLHHNNIEMIRAVVTRYFGTGPAADKAEYLLLQRIAERAHSYMRPEDPDQWLAKCAATECDRLGKEAIRDKAHSR
jgi:hypothetical protein